MVVAKALLSPVWGEFVEFDVLVEGLLLADCEEETVEELLLADCEEETVEELLLVGFEEETAKELLLAGCEEETAEELLLVGFEEETICLKIGSNTTFCAGIVNVSVALFSSLVKMVSPWAVHFVNSYPVLAVAFATIISHGIADINALLVFGSTPLMDTTETVPFITEESIVIV